MTRHRILQYLLLSIQDGPRLEREYGIPASLLEPVVRDLTVGCCWRIHDDPRRVELTVTGQRHLADLEIEAVGSGIATILQSGEVVPSPRMIRRRFEPPETPQISTPTGPMDRTRLVGYLCLAIPNALRLWAHYGVPEAEARSMIERLVRREYLIPAPGGGYLQTSEAPYEQLLAEARAHGMTQLTPTGDHPCVTDWESPNTRKVRQYFRGG